MADSSTASESDRLAELRAQVIDLRTSLAQLEQRVITLVTPGDGGPPV